MRRSNPQSAEDRNRDLRDSPPNRFDQLSEPPPGALGDVFVASPILAQSLFQVSRVPHKYGFAYSALGTAPHLGVFSGHEEFSEVARSDGFDFESPALALTKCVFELLERVWSPRTEESDLTFASRNRLGDAAEDPRRFTLLGESEYARTCGRYVVYDDDLDLHWTECRRVRADGEFETTMVPALFVYPGFGLRHREQRFVPTLSPGLAAQTRYDECILHGIYEVIERDAFAIAWLARLPATTMAAAKDFLRPRAQDILDELRDDGFEVTILDLTLDIPIPVALTVIASTKRDETFTAALGLGCNLDPMVATEKSLAEALLMLTNDYAFTDAGPLGRPSRNNKDAEHFPASERAAAIRDLTRPLEQRPRPEDRKYKAEQFHDPSDELAACLGILEREGLEALFCDLTPSVADTGSRFCLTRVLIPGLQPMLYEPDCWRIANDRLYEVPAKLGLRARRLTESDLRLEPNPFAWHAL